MKKTIEKTIKQTDNSALKAVACFVLAIFLLSGAFVAIVFHDDYTYTKQCNALGYPNFTKYNGFIYCIDAFGSAHHVVVLDGRLYELKTGCNS